MSLVINHNNLASRAANDLTSNYAQLAKSTERISTGLRINSAADDASGLAVRELMRADITALHQGIRNANDAISMLQTNDGALAIIDEKLIRMKELAEQASTGTYDSTQRSIIDSEFQQMAKEIDRIANSTDFNGIKILNQSLSSSSGTGSDGNEYVTTVTNADNYTWSDQAQIPIGSTNFVVRSSKYAYFNGSDNSLSVTVNSGIVSDQSYTVGWDSTNNHWTVSGFTYDSDILNVIGNNGMYTTSGNQIYVQDNGQLISFTVSVYDSNNNAVTDYSSLGSSTATLDLASLTDTSFPTFTLTTGSGSGTLTATQNGNGVTFSIDMGNGNTFDKTYSDYLTVSSAKFTVTNKIKEDGSDSIPEDVVKIHFGSGNDSSEDYYYINKQDVTLSGLGLSTTNIQTQENAQKALNTIDDAIVTKDKARAYLGTMQNRLENTVTNLTVQAENLQTAESRISDVDIAVEMASFVRKQILSQSAVAMLAQSYTTPQYALRLIGG